MYTIQCRNVADALPRGVEFLTDEGVIQETRNGKAYVARTPVCTVYSHPTERVLFNVIRDANPFFHLCESVWMLNGNDDAEFLNYYVRDFGDRFGDDGTIMGAYGYRWRHNFGFDQLDECYHRLLDNPDDRQCVIQMWDAHEDHANDLKAKVHDRPCNTQIFLRINDGKLDLTTTARSHDLLWGAYGANCVHFSFLQEYLANKLHVPCGYFYQFSHNYHLYVSALDTLRKRIDQEHPYWRYKLADSRYYTEKLVPLQLVDDGADFDTELEDLMTRIRRLQTKKAFDYPIKDYRNKFLSGTVWPMAIIHSYFRTETAKHAITMMNEIFHIAAPDWLIATKEWLERRLK